MTAKGADFGQENPENLFMWQTYLALRQSQSETGFIPVSEVVAYCDLIGVSDIIQRARVLRYVNELSAVEHANSQT